MSTGTATAPEATAPTVGGRHGQKAVEQKLPPAQAHQATIAGVIARTYNSGTVALVITHQSRDTDATFEQKLFLPDDFAADPNIDPSTLSEDAEFNEETGREKMSARQKYARTIANTNETKFQGEKVAGNADLQILSRIAEGQSKTDDERDQQGLAYDGIDDFAARYNTLLTGVETVILVVPQEKGEFRGRLEFRRAYEPNEAINLYNRGKLFKAGGKKPIVVMWSI